MSVEEEALVWAYFWCGVALIFLILWVITNIKNK